ncbi:MAG: heparinase II/III family protein [Oscillospiraceae bacterium]|nr:heparinase II/III family protein [Oscillospiraceae bacterium]
MIPDLSQLEAALRLPHTAPLQPDLQKFALSSAPSYVRQQAELLKQKGAEYLQSETPVLSYSLFTQFWQTGERKNYENLYFNRRGRLLTFALLSWLYPTQACYIDALTEIIWSICSEPFWCLPAHFLDAQGADLPFEAYETQLDLFACETGCGLAEALHIAGNLLPKTVVQQAKAQIHKRCIAPFLNTAVTYRFEQMTNNWSGVCGGALGMVGLYCIEEPALLAVYLKRCMASCQVYLNSFGADGVCTEGVDYWSYGFGFFTCFAQMLASRTQNGFNYFALPKVQAIAASQQYFYFSQDNTLSFADGSEHSNYRCGLSHFLQGALGAPCPPASLAANVLQDHCYRFCLALRDFLWVSADIAALPPVTPQPVYLPQAEWFLARTGSLSLAAKAGHNGESHNHNDCGSFILHKNGQAVFCDYGSGLYDAAYFSEKRYEIFVTGSVSHNVPILNGQFQQAGGCYHTKVLATNLDQNPNVFLLDATSCYPQNTALAFTRKFEVDIEKNRICLYDDILFAQAGSVTEVFCGAEEIELACAGVAVFCRNGEKVHLHYDAQQFTASVVTHDFTDNTQTLRHAWQLHLTLKQDVHHYTANFIFN